MKTLAEKAPYSFRGNVLFGASVVILLLVFDKKQDRCEKRQELGDETGRPDTVEIEEMRQYDDRQDFKKKRPQKGDQGRHLTVMKRGEESRSEYRKTHDHVGFAVKCEALFGHVKKCFVASEEQLGKGPLDTKRDAVKDKAHDDDEDRALFKCLMQFPVVFYLVLVTEYRSDTDGKSEEDRAE